MIQVDTSSTLTQTTQKSENKPGKTARKSESHIRASKKLTKAQNGELAYQLAFLLTTIIEEDLSRGTRHYRTKSGQLLTTVDQVIQAACKRNLLITVPGDTTFYVPPSFARCPYCEGRLYASFTAWSQEPDGTWIGLEMEMECEHEPDVEEDEAAWDWWLESHSETPYIYWLPVSEKVKRWINGQYRFAKGEFELPGERRENAEARSVTVGEL